MRRFTRLTNGFSKKWENHWAALGLWFAFYNFCRVHSKLRVTPAMEAGITTTSGACGNCFNRRVPSYGMVLKENCHNGFLPIVSLILASTC
jgi:hypothetical protein